MDWSYLLPHARNDEPDPDRNIVAGRSLPSEYPKGSWPGDRRGDVAHPDDAAL
jgi:hypothetical protein